MLAPGPLTLPTDAGRPGLAALGVSPSGAFDRGGYALANRLAGNPEGAPALEVTLGGLAVRARGEVLCVLPGADARARLEPRAAAPRPAAPHTPLYLVDGDVLRLGTPRVGLRTYLATRGGLEFPATLGSASADLLSGLGPSPLRAGDLLGIRPLLGDFPVTDTVGVAGPDAGALVLDALPGPRDDWFDLTGLAAAAWRITAASNRIGVRLTGEPLTRRPAFEGRELPSEPTVRGSVQVPPDGLPVIFGPDHPVTGGYPVIAVLTAAALDLLAQGRPGQEVRLRLGARPDPEASHG